MKKINELFFMRPWAVKEDLLSPMADIVERHLANLKLSKEDIEAATQKSSKGIKPDYEVMNGVARIPIYGVIAKRASLVNGVSQPQGTSVEEIAKNFRAAVKDESVKAIALDIDSPGGSVDGILELSDTIYAACQGPKQKKEVYAYANGQMCSAAYWIGSAANKIYATKSTEVGSIGVYAVMTDWTVANHNEGIKREVIKAGKHKATGHPDKPITEEDRAVVQSEVNEYYKLFTDAVAKHRGMTREAIEQVATGRVFIGSQALDAGLIDGIDEIDSVFEGAQEGARAQAAEVPKAAIEQGAGIEAGSQPTQQEEENAMDLTKLTLEEFRAARADLANQLIAEGQATGKAEAETVAKDARDKESARVAGIRALAKTIEGVESTALECIETGKSVEDSEKAMKDAKLAALKRAAPAPLGGGNAAEEGADLESLPHDEKCAKMWEKNVSGCRDEFSSLGSFKAFTKYHGKGAIRISDKK